MRQKATWIIHLIIGIISSFFIYSCETVECDCVPPTVSVYTYINKSKYSISIEKWKNGTKKVFSLPVSDSIVQEADSLAEINDLILNADSLDIIFDNSKKLSLTLKGTISTNNILWLGNYKNTRDINKDYYTYTFSNIDYDSAVDCNGNCN